MRPRPFLLCILLIAGGPAAHGQDARGLPDVLRFRRLTENDGLSHNGVTSFAQDRRGYVWIGTSEGVNRFDGYDCRTYRFDATDPASLSSNDVLSVLASRSGALWVATPRSGLNRYDPDRDGFVRYAPRAGSPASLGARRMTALLEDGSGNLWVGFAQHGIDRYDPATDGFIHFRHDPARRGTPPSDSIIAGHVDAAGDPVFATAAGITRFDRTERRFVSYPGYRSICRARNGDVWCRTLRGDFERRAADWRLLGTYPIRPGPRIQRGQRTPEEQRNGEFTHLFRETPGGAVLCVTADAQVYLHRPGETAFHSCSPRRQFPDFGKLYHAFIDSRGVLWLAASSGLYLHDAATCGYRRFTGDEDNPGSLAGTRITQVFEDRSGVLWAGSFEGGVTLCERVEPRFRTIRPPEPDAERAYQGNVRAIAQDPAGSVWVGALSGLTRYDATLTHPRSIPCGPPGRDGPEGYAVGALCRAGDTALWVGTWDGTLSCVDLRSGRWSNHTTWHRGGKGPLPGIRSVHVGIDGTVWLGTIANSLLAYDPLTRRGAMYRVVPDTPDGAYVFALVPDRAGCLLVATDHGLYRFDLRSRRFLPSPGDASRPLRMLDRDVRSVFVDRHGTIWAGSNGDGLYRLLPGSRQWTAIREQQGLPNNTVYAILPDAGNGLWLSTNRGICRYDARTGAVRSFSAVDGLQGSEFNTQAACRLADGRLCFGGINGLNVFHPDSIPQRGFRPPVVISGFRVANEPRLAPRDTVHLASDERSFSFEFAALDFFQQHRSQYAYRLEGVDTGWVFSGTRHFVSYSNVAPGCYTFRVRAYNAEGLSSARAASLTIVIPPPWWRAPAALLIYGILAIIGVSGVNRVMRTRVIRKERAETSIRESQLRAQTAEAYARALQAENERKELELLKSRELSTAYRALEQSMEQLTRTQEALVVQEKLASLGQLTAGIAHEIKNPLNFVINFTSLARELLAELYVAEQPEERLRLSSDLARTLARIEEHGQRADSILRRMMFHTRGKPGDRKPEDLSLLLREAVLAASDGMSARLDGPVAIDLRVDETLPAVPVVADHISLVLLNLLQNAMYAADHHARNSGGGAPQVRVDLRQAADGVEVIVSDNGPGVPPDLHARIFEPFFTTKPGSDGTGLGLSISHDIVTSHGGTLSLAPDTGEGATFIVTLPRG